MITVERHSLSAGLKIAQHQARCRRLLTIGNLVIYFEGGRSSDGTIKQCKNSIAELIFDNLHSNGQSGFIKNIVPMRIFGFTEIQPPESDKHSLKKAKLNPWQVAKNKKCQVVVGKSINDLIKPDHTVEDIKQIIYESVSSITI